MHLRCAALASLTLAAAHPLGPGRGEWLVDKAENHGLNSAALSAAAKLTAKVAPERYCLLVVKDGVIIEEQYFGNTSESLYETDSLGKTAVVMTYGVAAQQGLLDIDKPLADYGVEPATASGPGPTFEGGHSWGKFWPNVTMRTLMAQSSGYGVVEPGSSFTYDSQEYIQHLSYGLSAVVPNKSALAFAKEHYAVPLGAPEYFDYDDVLPEQGGPQQISAGGGQMVTCREMARFGQLMANKGKWLDQNMAPFQLVQEKFMEEMVQPAYPGVIDGYGFLTWLNTDMTETTPVKRSHCCGPRWNVRDTPTCATNKAGEKICGMCCQAAQGYNATSPVPCLPLLPVIPENGGSRSPTTSDPCEVVHRSIIGDSFPDADFHNAPNDLAFGMGQWAKYMFVHPESNLTVVSIGQSKGGSLDCTDAYNDGYTLSLIWRVMEAALGFGPEGEKNKRPIPPNASDHSKLPFAQYKGTPRPEGDLTRDSIRQARAQHEAAKKARGSAVAAEEACCTCVCPPFQGFGNAWNIPASEARKHPFVKNGGTCPSALVGKFVSAQAMCPVIGAVQQCDKSQIGTQTCPYPGPGASLCELVPGQKELSTAGCRMPLSNYWQECEWTTGACEYNPYYPILNYTASSSLDGAVAFVHGEVAH